MNNSAVLSSGQIMRSNKINQSLPRMISRGKNFTNSLNVNLGNIWLRPWHLGGQGPLDAFSTRGARIWRNVWFIQDDYEIIALLSSSCSLYSSFFPLSFPLLNLPVCGVSYLRYLPCLPHAMPPAHTKDLAQDRWLGIALLPDFSMVSWDARGDPVTSLDC